MDTFNTQQEHGLSANPSACLLPAADKRSIDRAIALLNAGDLVSFPTETVYGLGADADNESALTAIFSAKGRPADHPLIVHLATVQALENYAQAIPEIAWRLAERFWPGPLTLILKRAPTVSQLITGGQDTIGLRIPAHPVAQQLLNAFGRGIAAPSANRFGRISPTSARHVVAELGNRVNAILDGGDCSVGLESTILDLSGSVPRLLRPGAISLQNLADELDQVPQAAGGTGPRVPGQLASHYCPQSPLALVASADLEPVFRQQTSKRRIAVMAISPQWQDQANCFWVTMPALAAQYAQRLYAQLRELDDTGFDLILVEQPPDTPQWDAVRDRLSRAAGGTG